MATYNDLVTRFSFEGSTQPLVNFNQLTETMTEALSESQRQFAELAKSLSGANDEFNEAASGVDKLSKETNNSSDEFSSLGKSSKKAGHSVADAGEKIKDTDKKTASLTDSLREGASQIESFGKKLVGAQAAIVATIGGISFLADMTAQSIDPFVQVSRVTGESIEDMQAWGYAASQNGSSIDAVSDSMLEMNLRMGEFARSGGGPAAEVFKQFGINIRDAEGDIISASELMVKLNKEMQGLSEGERLDLLDKVGADKSLVQLLGSSSEQIEDLRKKALALGVTTKEEADQFAAYNDSLTTTKYGVSSLAKTIALGMLPTLKDVSDSFADFMIDNQEWLKDTAKNVGEFFGAMIDSFTRMLPVLKVATAVMTAYWVATGGAATAMAILASPITALIAGATAFYLIIDDLIVALDGGQSVIRDFFLESFDFDIIPLLESIKEAFEDIFGYINNIIEPMKNIFISIGDAISSLITGNVKGALSSILDAFAYLGEMIFNALIAPAKTFTRLAKGIVEGLGGDFSKISGFAGKAVESIKGFFINLKNWIVGFFDFDLFGGIAESAKSIGSGIANTASDAYGFVAENAGKVADKVSGFFSGLFDGDADSGIKDTLRSATNMAKDAASKVGGFFTGLFDGGGSSFEAIGKAGVDVFNSIGETAKNVFNAPSEAIDTLKNTLANFGELGISVFNGIGKVAVSIFNAPLAIVESLAGSIGDLLGGAFGRVADSASSAIKTISSMMNSALTSVGKFVLGGAQSVLSSLSELFSSVFSAITETIGGLFSSMFVNAASEALSLFVSAFDSIKSMLSGLFDGFKEAVVSVVPDFILPDSMKEGASAKLDLSAIEQARAKSESNHVFNQSSMNTVNNTSQEATVNVYSSDPVEAGNQVADQLNGQLASARYSAARGGM